MVTVRFSFYLGKSFGSGAFLLGRSAPTSGSSEIQCVPLSPRPFQIDLCHVPLLVIAHLLRENGPVRGGYPFPPPLHEWKTGSLSFPPFWRRPRRAPVFFFPRKVKSSTSPPPLRGTPVVFFFSGSQAPCPPFPSLENGGPLFFLLCVNKEGIYLKFLAPHRPAVVCSRANERCGLFLRKVTSASFFFL